MNESEEQATPRPSPDQEGELRKKQPRWTIPFLRALERTGVARAAAEDAGVDHTTAYNRRKGNAGFAAAWGEALKAHKQRREKEQAEEIAALRNASSPQPLSREGRGADGEEFIVSGGQVKRAGHDSWTKRKEKIFFDELAGTNNIQGSAMAVGMSGNAVHQRRLRDAHFKAKLAAVVECGKAAIHMHLVEEGRKAFDPEDLETGDVQPKVTVDQAMRIVQLGGSKKQEAEELPDPFAEEAASMTADEVAALREKMVRKLRRLRDRDMPNMIAQGWSFDEEHDQMVPPGWVKAADDEAGEPRSVPL